MTNYEYILLGWNILLTFLVIIHALKFAIIERILTNIVTLLEHRRRKNTIDALYGRDND